MKATVYIDGWHLQVLVRQAGHRYDPDYVNVVALACVAGDETLLRVLYYDCAPQPESSKLPVSGGPAVFQGSHDWLKLLAAKSQFAVRLGTPKFQRYEPRRVTIASTVLSEEDFKPRLERKGVDMRLGLDIASYAADQSIDRINGRPGPDDRRADSGGGGSLDVPDERPDGPRERGRQKEAVQQGTFDGVAGTGFREKGDLPAEAVSLLVPHYVRHDAHER